MQAPLVYFGYMGYVSTNPNTFALTMTDMGEISIAGAGKTKLTYVTRFQKLQY